MSRFAILTTILALFAVSPHAQAAPAPDLPHVDVHFADLDLARADGIKALFGRLHAAAETVCESLDDQSLVDQLSYRQCIHAALATAVARVNRPGLTAYYSRATGGARSGRLLTASK